MPKAALKSENVLAHRHLTEVVVAVPKFSNRIRHEKAYSFRKPMNRTYLNHLAWPQIRSNQNDDNDDDVDDDDDYYYYYNNYYYYYYYHYYYYYKL